MRLAQTQLGKPGLCADAFRIPWRRNQQILLQMLHRRFTPVSLKQHISGQQMCPGNLRRSILEMFKGFLGVAGLRKQNGCQDEVQPGIARLDSQCSPGNFSGFMVPVHTNQRDGQIAQRQPIGGRDGERPLELFRSVRQLTLGEADGTKVVVSTGKFGVEVDGLPEVHQGFPLVAPGGRSASSFIRFPGRFRNAMLRFLMTVRRRLGKEYEDGQDANASRADAHFDWLPEAVMIPDSRRAHFLVTLPTIRESNILSFLG